MQATFERKDQQYLKFSGLKLYKKLFPNKKTSQSLERVTQIAFIPGISKIGIMSYLVKKKWMISVITFRKYMTEIEQKDERGEIQNQSHAE